MSRSVTGSLLRSKNQELVVANYLRIHGETSFIPQDIIDLIILYFVRFDFMYSRKMYTQYFRNENKTCWINSYFLLKCCVSKYGCTFQIEKEKLSTLVSDVKMQLNLYCNEVSKSWNKRFQVGKAKICISQELFKYGPNKHRIKTLTVIWNTKIISIEYKPSSMICEDMRSNIYTLNVDTKEKLEWLITGANAKHILFKKHNQKSCIQQIYWYQKTFHFRISNKENVEPKFVIRLFGEQKTFHLKITQQTKSKITVKFDGFESLYYQLKSAPNSKPVISTRNVLTKQKTEQETINIRFDSKPFGFSIRDDTDGLNAIINRVKTSKNTIKLKKGLYIRSINDIVIDNKPFAEIKSLLRTSLPPINVIFGKRPHSNISISSRYTALQLINGYIRQIDLFIPQIMNQICLQFYFTSMLIYCFITNSAKVEHRPLHIADVNDEIKKTLKNFECDIYCLNEPECIETGIDTASATSYGLCVANNLKLPQNIHHQLMKNYKLSGVEYYRDSPNTVLFKIGGWCNNEVMDDCYGTILTDSQFITKKEEEQTNSVKEIDAFTWRLPPLPYPFRDVCACFCGRRQSLVCVGGQMEGNEVYVFSNGIYSLSFLDSANMEWEWMAGMRQPRASAASVFIENENKLLIVTGRNENFALNSGEIYDYATKQMKGIANAPFKRFNAGICYDRTKNNVYLGGGCVGIDHEPFGSKAVAFYDIFKDKWYTHLKSFKGNHVGCPVLWINNNILSIMSARSRTIEYLDLRVNAGWNRMSQNDLLTETLGIDCGFTDIHDCRLSV